MVPAASRHCPVAEDSRLYAVSRTIRIFLQASPLTFDTSIFEIWGTLLDRGAELVIPEQACYSIDTIAAAIKEQHNDPVSDSGLFNLINEHSVPLLCASFAI